MIQVADAGTILWREMLVLKREFWKYMASILVSPLLYLITFGLGLGRNIIISGGSYLDFVVPGIIALSAMTASFNAVGVYINIHKLYDRTLEEYQIAPISALSFAVGKILAGCVRGLLAALVIMVLAALFGAQMKFGWGALASVFMNCFIFAALGLILGLLAKSHQDMANLSTFVVLPMAFLCDTFFPLQSLPPYLTGLINVLPLTQATGSLRALLLGMEANYISFIILLTYAMVFLIGGIYVVKKVR